MDINRRKILKDGPQLMKTVSNWLAQFNTQTATTRKSTTTKKSLAIIPFPVSRQATSSVSNGGGNDGSADWMGRFIKYQTNRGQRVTANVRNEAKKRRIKLQRDSGWFAALIDEFGFVPFGRKNDGTPDWLEKESIKHGGNFATTRNKDEHKEIFGNTSLGLNKAYLQQVKHLGLELTRRWRLVDGKRPLATINVATQLRSITLSTPRPLPPLASINMAPHRPFALIVNRRITPFQRVLRNTQTREALTTIANQMKGEIYVRVAKSARQFVLLNLLVPGRIAVNQLLKIAKILAKVMLITLAILLVSRKSLVAMKHIFLPTFTSEFQRLYTRTTRTDFIHIGPMANPEVLEIVQERAFEWVQNVLTKTYKDLKERI
jgi:hypothetical protein